MQKMFCKLKKYLFKEYPNETEQWTPSLTNEELASIEEPQAKLIYDNAIGVLRDIQYSIDCIVAKAESMFKYLFAIESAVISFCLYKARSSQLLNISIFSVLAILPLVLMYVICFLPPKNSYGIYNIPKYTITKRALKKLAVFYLLESIEIQKITIPYNLANLNKKVFWLHCMIIYTVIALCLFFFGVFNYIQTIV